jgi:hypothetical protein
MIMGPRVFGCRFAVCGSGGRVGSWSKAASDRRPFCRLYLTRTLSASHKYSDCVAASSLKPTARSNMWPTGLALNPTSARSGGVTCLGSHVVNMLPLPDSGQGAGWQGHLLRARAAAGFKPQASGCHQGRADAAGAEGDQETEDSRNQNHVSNRARQARG